MRKVTIKVNGISCAMCAKSIEGTFKNIEGASAFVNVNTSKVTLQYDDNRYTLTQLAKFIEQAGYEPVLSDDDNSDVIYARRQKRDILISIILTLPLLWTMFHHLKMTFVPMPKLLMNPYFQLALATPIQFYIGRHFYRGAWYSLKTKNLGMDALVVMGTSSAYFYSIYQIIVHELYGRELHLYFESGAVIVTVILIGHYFEKRVKSRTEETLKHLVGLTASSANVIRDGKEETIDINNVVVGDLLVVRQGEKIPIDGVVEEGISHVDESMINGEPIPRIKNVGEKVFGSTINLDATIKVRAEKVGEDTLLAHIIRTVEEAQLSKPPIQRIADRIANIFVPTVSTIAIITFIGWYIYSGDFEYAFSAAVAVLVISCPCALGLATPTSIMVGSGKAASNGILYRGGEFFEKANKISAICFDKTGTITIGKPTVNEFIGEIDALKYAYAIEKHSTHPIAEAICQYAEDKETQLVEVTDFKSLIGKGLKGIVDNKEVIVGSRSYIEELNINLSDYHDDYQRLVEQGKTSIFVVVDNEVVALIAIFDKIKDDAKKVISKLNSMGIDTYMITGDNEVVAKQIANQVGIKHFYAEVMPDQKANYVNKIRQSGEVVAFAGDGINDAPALKTADIGIAMGSGTDIAINSADITLIHDDLTSLIKAIRMSRYTLKNIYQNFFWAFSYNIIAIPLAASGQLNPMIAGLAMAFSNITVVLNALRLKRVKLDKEV